MRSPLRPARCAVYASLRPSPVGSQDSLPVERLPPYRIETFTLSEPPSFAWRANGSAAHLRSPTRRVEPRVGPVSFEQGVPGMDSQTAADRRLRGTRAATPPKPATRTHPCMRAKSREAARDDLCSVARTWHPATHLGMESRTYHFSPAQRPAAHLRSPTRRVEPRVRRFSAINVCGPSSRLQTRSSLHGLL